MTQEPAVQAENAATHESHAHEAHEAHETHEAGIHIPPMAAERLGEVAGIPINNTLVTSWVVMVLLIGLAYFVGRKLTMVPSKAQLAFESLIGFVYDFMSEAFESRTLARTFLPLVLTLFLFIFASNALEFTPGIGSVGFHSEDGHGLIPLFRSVNTDLNVTLAFAIISVVAIQVAGFMQLGFFKYMGKFLNFKSFIGFFVGIIELASEFVRLVSFSFRLFGNIFAGEVLIGVVAYFVPYVLLSALMSFELFVGLVQAGIFALLTILFIKQAVAEPH